MALDAYLGTGGGNDPQRAAAAYLLAALRRNLPGYPTDDRLAQSRHYTGAVYLFTQVYMDAMGQATATVLRRRPKKSERTPPFAKALPTPGGQSQDQDWVPVRPSHPLCQLLEYPNRNETLTDTIRQMMLQYWLTGSAPLWANPNRAGVPVELWVLPTALLWPQPVPVEDYPEGAWRLNWYRSGVNMAAGTGGAGAVIDGRQIRRLVNEHELWRWDAKSPLTAAAKQMDILEAIDDSSVAVFRHGINLDTLFMLPGATAEQIAALSADMQNSHAGATNWRKPLAIGGGMEGSKFTAQQLNPNVRELDFTNSRQQALEFAGAIFGVPKGVAGFTSAGSYSEFFAELKQFFLNKLRPMANRLGQLFTAHLARHWPDQHLKVQFDLPTMDDPDLLERRLSADGQNGTLDYNEYRALRGMPPKTGGDVPVPIYLAKMQQEAAPEGQPGGAPPGGGNAQAPAGSPPPAALEEPDESGGVVPAVLAALGVQGGDESGMVQKATAPGVGLTEKDITVHRGGKTFTQKRRVRTGEDPTNHRGNPSQPPNVQSQLAAHPDIKAYGLTPALIAKMHPDAVRQFADALGIKNEPAPAPAVAPAPASSLHVPSHVPLAPADKPAVAEALRAAKPKLRQAVARLKKQVAALQDELRFQEANRRQDAKERGDKGKGGGDLPQALWVHDAEVVPRSGGKPKPRTPSAGGVSGAQSFQRWGGPAAVKHAPAVAKTLGISLPAAAHVLHHAFSWVARQVGNAVMAPGRVGAKVAGAVDRLDERLTNRVFGGGKPGAPATRTARALLGDAAGPARPKNRGGKGSLPPRQKAMNTLTGSAGGFLAGCASPKRKRRRKLAAFLKAELEVLTGAGS